MTGPSIRLAGLPDFNAGDSAFKITAFDGWYATAKPRAELLPSGVSHGATAVGPWDFAEAYYTLSGVIRSADRATLLGYRRDLLAALPAAGASPITVLGNDEDVDLLVDVRRYDQPDIRVVANNLMFTFPLVAVDPFKYAATALSASMAAFNGSDWFATFEIDGGGDDWLDLGADTYLLAFETDSSAAADQAAVLFSPGDALSRRLTFTVTGPLDQGDWFLLHENTGQRLYADLALTAAQTLTFDCYAQRATLNGSEVDTLVFGDYLTLLPGDNTYRLVTGADSDGSAAVEGRPAYE